MDNISKEHRSWNMSRIKNKDTKPEIRVRQMLFKMGYRFRLHRKDLPGRPDIVLVRKKTIIFVHGCYWHRHEGCRFAYNPQTRQNFWQKKFDENAQRDKKNQAMLMELGWNVHVIWECETKNDQKLTTRLKEILQ